LLPNQRLVSSNGLYEFKLQQDGNFVGMFNIFSSYHAFPSSRQLSCISCITTIDITGYTINGGVPFAHTNTANIIPNAMTLFSNGNLVLSDTNNVVRWSSNYMNGNSYSGQSPFRLIMQDDRKYEALTICICLSSIDHILYTCVLFYQSCYLRLFGCLKMEHGLQFSWRTQFPHSVVLPAGYVCRVCAQRTIYVFRVSIQCIAPAYVCVASQ
jgi:hypothetical protein